MFRDIGLAVRVFANGLGDLSSIPGRVIPKDSKMVLDASLLNTQHYKVRIKGKVEQCREGVAPSPTPCVVVATKKGAFGLPSTMVANFTFYFTYYLGKYSFDLYTFSTHLHFLKLCMAIKRACALTPHIQILMHSSTQGAQHTQTHT